MKKYDLILAVLYILPVILGFIIFYNLKNPSDQEMEKAGLISKNCINSR